MQTTEKRVKRVHQCYGCGKDIIFDKDVKSENGKFIPLNPDRTPHDCPESEYNKRKQRKTEQMQ